MRRVPDVIQPASSGRAKCRGCGVTIKTGELRFGESAPNPYAEGETLAYYHLRCAACFRPEKFLPCLQAQDPAQIREFDELQATAEVGIAHPRLVRLQRAERAASARAKCRHCHEPQEKGSWRLALHVFEDGRFSPMGTLHVTCAPAYFGTRDLAERIRTLTPDLDAASLAEIEQQLAQAAAPDLEQGPGVARARDAEDAKDEASNG